MGGRVRFVEKRGASRVPIRVLVEYERLDDFLADYTSSVSLGGMFIHTEDPLPMDTRFRLRFTVPTRDTAVEAYAVVRWVVPVSDGMTPGMGVDFEPLSEADQKAVEAWLEQW